MEDDGEGSSPGTPFWVQSSRGSRRQISSIFLNSGILIVFLCLSAVFTILFIIPWFLSLTSQILRPNLVKKSWDWFNAVLIILALIFGFLSRNKNTDDEDRTVLSAQKSLSQTSTLFQWDDRGASNASIRTQKLQDNWYENGSSFGLKRNSSSYPDLRDMTSSLDQRQFLDDTHVENSGIMLDSDQVRRRRIRTEVQRDLGSDGSKEIYIDTETTINVKRKEVNLTTTPRPSFPPTGRELRDAEQKTDPEWKQVMGHLEKTKKRSSLQGLPPSLTAAELPEKKKSSSKGERKRSGGTTTKEFLNSFYHQSKKKKNQRAKSLDNFESLLGKHDLSVPPPPPTPPSPPPPPPPRTSVFQNILSAKKRTPKKIISVPAPPPPPPPPARTERKPLVPAKRINSNKAVKTHEDSPMTMGNESPLHPIPPPPPPPPFKMPSWKFVVQGDYVRVGSFNSSISEHESSDVEERESPTSEISNTDSGGTLAPAPALFCPSPDVNTKAEMFIAKFRAGLELQKINSLEQKQRLGMSNLGPQAQYQSHDQAQAQIRNARK